MVPGGWNAAFSYRYEEVARKNGKSTKLAGLGLYLFSADKEAGAQVYTAATKLEQAKITHAAAEMMVAKSPALRQLIQNHKNKLWIPGTANKFIPLGADANTQDGLNVHGAIIDELHAHPSRALWDVIDTARGARRRSLMHAITTSGFNQDGSICLEQRNYLIQILEGQLDDDSFGGVIYTWMKGMTGSMSPTGSRPTQTLVCRCFWMNYAPRRPRPGMFRPHSTTF
ncbi:hypothetical protein GKE73_16830 [Paludibacterium sp. dN 18-1]|uniref:Terminase large subunit-like ATPase domain-containing protein n=1 Tax=Paludibacterium denitrificans TaxID=2675226 RepID=A0A844GHW6_9NEIS|nr:terminase large subunit [Paludibacterium denitrificans]MTD34085.1 hypothetical protein [Paludibacterium denitrificans]